MGDQIKIAVLGSGGQMGQAFLEHMQGKTDFHLANFTSKDLNITRPDDIMNAQLSQYDYVVNFAAYTAVDKAETEIEEALDINWRGVRNIVEALKNTSTKLIHLSTDYVFDGDKKSAYVEEDLPNPISIYGLSKQTGEQAILAAHKLSFVILRTQWIYSEYGNNFLKTMINLAAQKQELNIINDQYGAPTYAGDIAQVVYQICCKPFVSGIFHYSALGQVNWHAFAIEIFKILNEAGLEIPKSVQAISSAAYNARAMRPANGILNCKKIRKIYQVEQRPWLDSLYPTVQKIIKGKCS